MCEKTYDRIAAVRAGVGTRLMSMMPPRRSMRSREPRSLADARNTRSAGGVTVLGFVLAVLVWGSSLEAQVLDPSKLLFNSTDHTTTLTDGSPAITAYQALLLGATTDPVTGTALQIGTIVPKAQVTIMAGVVPPEYTLTLTQLGLTVPVCTVPQASCPLYKATLLAIGPNGTSVRGVASTSGPFGARSAAAPPAGPTNVRPF